MRQTILFDLDNTLLENDMARFMPRYLPLLAGHVMRLVPGATFDFVPALLWATEQMMANTKPSLTNEALFWEALQERTGVDWDALEARPYLDAFYRGVFHEIRQVTKPRPVAVELVRWAQARGLGVVIATNPLFPRSAIEARLAWAGLPVSEFSFELVTHYGNMHATKPLVAYYEEILEQLGVSAEGCLMVGDDWENDVLPTAVLGMSNFWLGQNPPDETKVTAWGTLADLAVRLHEGWWVDG